MSKIERFEDIIAWQKARMLVNELYSVIETNIKFKRDYNLERPNIPGVVLDNAKYC